LKLENVLNFNNTWSWPSKIFPWLSG